MTRSTRPQAAPVAPQCCGRPMSTISVTDADSELSLVSCSSCSRHAWVRDGQLLDRDEMLAVVRQRLAEVPRPRGGRPKGSGARQPARAEVDPVVQQARQRRVEEMRAMLQGFAVHRS